MRPPTNERGVRVLQGLFGVCHKAKQMFVKYKLLYNCFKLTQLCTAKKLHQGRTPRLS